MKKVLVFIGSRSNYGRLYPLIKELIEDGGFDVSLIIACSALSIDLPEEIRVLVVQRIHADMYHDIADNMSTTESLVTVNVANHLFNNSYDIAIVHGDRFETLGFAVACSYANLGLVHMESGEVSGNIDDKIRWAISALSDLCLCPTQKSMDLMLTLGNRFNAKFVGSPAVGYILNKEWEKYKWGVKYILVVYQPTDDDDYGLTQLLSFLVYAIQTQGHPIYWVSPNMDPGNRVLLKKIHGLERKYPKKVTFLKNLSVDKYLQTMLESIMIIGNSSSGIKEAAALEVPYILLPNRQQDREVDGNTITARSQQDIVKAYEAIRGGSLKEFKYTGLFGDRDVVELSIKYIKEVVGNNDRETKG